MNRIGPTRSLTPLTATKSAEILPTSQLFIVTSEEN